MKMTTLFKLTTLVGLLAWALPARAGMFYDNRVHSSSAALHVGFDGGSVSPANSNNDRVFTSSGAAVIQSTSSTSGHKVLRVKNSAGTDVLSTTEGGTTAGTFSGNITGNVTGNASGTAGSLAANGANCSAGNYPLGVDASGAVEGCTAVGVGDVQAASSQTLSGANILTSTVTVGTPALYSVYNTTADYRSVIKGGWTLVVEASATAVDLWSYGLVSSYTHQCELRTVLSADAIIQVQVNGAAGASDYRWATYRSMADGTSEVQGDTADSEGQITGTSSANGGDGHVFWIKITRPPITSKLYLRHEGAAVLSDGNWMDLHGSIAYDADPGVKYSLRFFPSTGNLTASYLRCWAAMSGLGGL